MEPLARLRGKSQVHVEVGLDDLVGRVEAQIGEAVLVADEAVLLLAAVLGHGHVPRGVRHAGGVLPEGGGGVGGGRARCAGLPRLPADPLEAPAHRQRAGEDQPRDEAQAARRAGVPLHGLAGAARGCGNVRAGRDVAGVQATLGGEDE